MKHQEEARTEAGVVPHPRTAGFGGAADGARDDLRVGEEVRGVAPVHQRRFVEGVLLVWRAEGGFAEMIGGDGAPGSSDAARLYQGDIDVERLQFHAHRVAECLHGVFRDMVPAAEVEYCPARDGGDVDDAAGVLRSHLRQDQPAEFRQAEEVNLQLGARLGFGHILHGAEVAVAGIVDQHVDAPFGGDDRFNAAAALLRNGNVQADRGHAVPPERLHGLDPPGRGIDLMAAQGQRPRRIEADAAASAGNEYDFG